MALIEGLAAPTCRVLHVAAFRRVVSDLDRSITFYCDALGFELDRVCIDSYAKVHGEGGMRVARKRAVLLLGDEALELVTLESGGDALPGTAARACSPAFQHFAVVAADMDAAFFRLARFDPSMISAGGPIRLPPATGSVTAVKFRDPDRHPLELIAFPPGAGDARWQRHAGDSVTLGIDHSAIVVADVSRSIAFYRDVLGCSVAAHQVNQGTEQDRLDGLDAVEVDVVALQAPTSTTPHLELLGYRNPRPTTHASMGRAACRDRIVWATEDCVAEVLVQDPDGHLHVLAPASRLSDGR